MSVPIEDYPIRWLILAVSMLSLGGLLAKTAGVDPYAIVFYRAIGAIVVSLFAWQRIFPLKFSLDFFIGAISFAISQIAFFAANSFTSASTAVFLQYTAKIYVGMLGGWYLGERATKADWISAIVVIFGMSFLLIGGAGSSNSGNLVGIALGILCGFSYSWVLMSLRRLKDGNPLQVIFFGNILSCIAVFPFLPRVSLASAEYVALIGIVQLGAPWIIMTRVIKRLTAMQVAVLTSLGPVLNPIWVFLAAGEIPHTLELIGAAIIFVGVTGQGIVAASYNNRVAKNR